MGGRGTYHSHINATRGASAEEKSRNISGVVVDTLHGHVVRADTGLQSSHKRRTNDAADVAGFKGTTGEDQGEGLADAGEDVVVIDTEEVRVGTSRDGGVDGRWRWA